MGEGRQWTKDERLNKDREKNGVKFRVGLNARGKIEEINLLLRVSPVATSAKYL
jgi:hypothetical protein